MIPAFRGFQSTKVKKTWQNSSVHGRGHRHRYQSMCIIADQEAVSGAGIGQAGHILKDLSPSDSFSSARP